MVKKATVFAISASIVSGAPVAEVRLSEAGVSLRERSSGLLGGLGGLLGGLLGGSGGVTVPISTSNGWNWQVAGVLQAVLGGASTGAIDPSSLQAFYFWVQHSGSHYFPPDVCQHLSSWCTGDPGTIISKTYVNTLQGLLLQLTSLTDSGSLLSFLNELVSQGAGGNCACSVVDPSALGILLAFIGTSDFQTLDPVVIGSLHTCASGGYSQILSSNAHNRCHSWLHSSQCHFPRSVVDAIDAWLNDNSFVYKRITSPAPTPPTAGSLLPIYLSSANQVALGSWFSTSTATVIDPNILGVLHVCAVGGIVSAVDPAAVTLLLNWAQSVSNPLSPSLITAIVNWATGTAGAGVVTLTNTATADYVTIGNTVQGYLTSNGALTSAAQDLLTSLIHNLPSLLNGGGSVPSLLNIVSSLPSLPNVGGSLPTNGLNLGIITSLTTAATGGLASALTTAQTSALVSYLTINAAVIPPTVHALVLCWTSQAIANPPAVSTVFGASITGGGAYTIPASALGLVLALASGGTLTPLVAGGIALAGSGIPVYYLSPAATAGLSSFLVSTSTAGVSSAVQGYLTEWLVGVAVPGL